VAAAGREALDREEHALRALDTALSEARAVATQRENDLAAFEAAEGPALAEALAQALQSGPDGLARALEAQAAALALAAQALDDAALSCAATTTCANAPPPSTRTMPPPRTRRASPSSSAA
jgi:hypothetical protein